MRFFEKPSDEGKSIDNMQKTQDKTIAVIDWVRFTCYWDTYAPFDDVPLNEELFRLLKVNRSHFVPGNRAVGRFGYGDGFTYAECLNVGISPSEHAKPKGIGKCFLVDMPATACHQFEDRGGSWADLFRFLLKSGCRFNRIDLAQDSIDGLTMEEIKGKISSDEFVCSFRSNSQGGHRGDQMYTHIHASDNPLADLDPNPVILDTKLGYTATFGNHGSTQELQIYDKSRERQSRGIGVTCKNWIRFEARFSYPRAGYVVKELLMPALESGTFGTMVSGLIRGLIEFKEVPKDFNNRGYHLNRLPIWRKYDAFLSGASKIKVPCLQNNIEASVTKSLRWANSSWNKALARFMCCGTDGIAQVMSSMVDELKEKGLSFELIYEVKNYYNTLHAGNSSVDVPTTEEIIDNLQTWCDTLAPDSPIDIRSLYDAMVEKLENLGSSTRFLADFSLDDSPVSSFNEMVERNMKGDDDGLDAFGLEDLESQHPDPKKGES